MKHRKHKNAELILPVLYVVFTVACIVLGFVFHEKKNLIYNAWSLLSAVVWIIVWVWAVKLVFKKRK